MAHCRPMPEEEPVMIINLSLRENGLYCISSELFTWEKERREMSVENSGVPFFRMINFGYQELMGLIIFIYDSFISIFVNVSAIS